MDLPLKPFYKDVILNPNKMQKGEESQSGK